MDHRAAQAEYRRLKAERADRLAREEVVRKERVRLAQMQRQGFVSYAELEGVLGVSEVTFLTVEPVDGGWKVTYTVSE